MPEIYQIEFVKRFLTNIYEYFVAQCDHAKVDRTITTESYEFSCKTLDAIIEAREALSEPPHPIL